MFCEKCGAAVAENAKFCQKCGASRTTISDTGIDQAPEAALNETNALQEEPVCQGLNGIALADEEVIVRTYRCSALKFPKCTGYLSVTTRRVLFHGSSGKSDYTSGSRIVNEVPLDAVSGISTFYGGKVLLERLIAGILFIISAIVVFSSNQETRYSDPSPLLTVIGFIGLLIGIFLLARCFRKTFSLKIFSSKASASPIDIGEGASGGIGKNSALFSVTANPTEETDKMMLELGAMIGDLQRMGDYGVEQWKQ